MFAIDAVDGPNIIRLDALPGIVKTLMAIDGIVTLSALTSIDTSV